MNYYPLCKKHLSFLFREFDFAINLPSVLCFVFPEDGQDG